METKDGFLVINKEKGCTSHDCVKQIRKLLNTKKVGHTGTLDPEVIGTLPIAIGSATRFIQYLPQGVNLPNSSWHLQGIHLNHILE